MNAIKINQSMINLDRALHRLQDVLKQPLEENDFILDAAIQRFEFTLEIFWKTLKRLLAYEGIETKTPKETLQHAYQVNWLHNESVWLQMLKDRNETSHIYDEVKAKEIYEHIKIYLPYFQKTYQFLTHRFADILSDYDEN